VAIPMLDLNREYLEIKDEIDAALNEVLINTNYIQGTQVKELESEVQNYINTNSAIGVASGTDALVLSLRTLAIKSKGKEYFSREDEVITTPFTFTATGGAILRSGATPVFVDIEPLSFNLDHKEVEKAVNKNTVGILPVHLYGQSCAMEEIIKIAERDNLFILEDVAQAFGAEYRGKKLGSIGDLGAFSFFPSKNLGAYGDGGMVATEDSELAELVGMLGKHGGRDKYNVDVLGYNSRLDTLQAAILLVKLKHVERYNRLRKELAVDWLDLPEEVEPGHVYHQYTIRIKGGKRDYVKDSLGEKGVDSAIYYPVLLTDMKLFKDRCRIVGNLSNAITACQEVLSLPIEPLLTLEEKQYIVESIKSIKL